VTGRAGPVGRVPFAAVEPVLSSFDLAICHLETPVAPPGGPLSEFQT
jgi:hypothetical protein